MGLVLGMLGGALRWRTWTGLAAGLFNDMVAAFGRERRAVVCRELTKTHEEIRRGTLGELAEWAHAGVLGETTLVVAGAAQTAAAGATPLADAVAEVVAAERAGMSRKDAIAQAAVRLGVPRRELYNAVVARSGGQGQ